MVLRKDATMVQREDATMVLREEAAVILREYATMVLREDAAVERQQYLGCYHVRWPHPCNPGAEKGSKAIQPEGPSYVVELGNIKDT